MEELKEATRILITAVNKANRAGAYTIDEAYTIKLACDIVVKHIETASAPKKGNAEQATLESIQENLKALKPAIAKKNVKIVDSDE